ncbi:MAG: PIN domain-containing protein, partial [Deltaproteobacteria bacterium]|nr:PIN domain-containing protein [Deltaproteobacteria bacterium]
MITAIDTNILIYAHREEAPHHQKAKRILTQFAEGNDPWVLPWPCIYEFLRVVTHPKVFHPPTPTEIAWAAIENLLQSPMILLLSEAERHPHILSDLVKATSIKGNILHDAHIAALLIENGILQILTADEDFNRFSGLKVID